MQSPLKMGELMHSPMKIQHLTLPEETREQLMQPPEKMGQLMHAPVKMEHLTLPQETRPNRTSLDQKICWVPDLCLGDLGVTWLWCNSIVAFLLCLCFFQEPRYVCCDCCPCRMLSPPS